MQRSSRGAAASKAGKRRHISPAELEDRIEALTADLREARERAEQILAAADLRELRQKPFDFPQPRYRDRYLAASAFYLKGSGDKDNDLVKRIRAAVAG